MPVSSSTRVMLLQPHKVLQATCQSCQELEYCYYYHTRSYRLHASLYKHYSTVTTTTHGLAGYMPVLSSTIVLLLQPHKVLQATCQSCQVLEYCYYYHTRSYKLHASLYKHYSTVTTTTHGLAGYMPVLSSTIVLLLQPHKVLRATCQSCQVLEAGYIPVLSSTRVLLLLPHKVLRATCQSCQVLEYCYYSHKKTTKNTITMSTRCVIVAPLFICNIPKLTITFL